MSLLKQGHPEPAAQETAEYLQGRRYHNLSEQPMPCASLLFRQNLLCFSLCPLPVTIIHKNEFDYSLINALNMTDAEIKKKGKYYLLMLAFSFCATRGTD